MYTQVRVEGTVDKVSEAESDPIFASRPRGHRASGLGLPTEHPGRRTASTCSGGRPEAEARFPATAPSLRPPYWGGYRLWPLAIEFWHGFENRLHDRLRLPA